MLTTHLLHTIITKVKNKLPEQGPLEFFVHHNTLHHYEHLDFTQALKQAALDYNCNAFMPDEYYLDQYQHNYIDKKLILINITEHAKKYNLALPINVIYDLVTYQNLDKYNITNSYLKKAQELREQPTNIEQ